MTAAVSRLDRVMAAIAADHDGTFVQDRGEGDSHFLVFDQASRAIAATAELRAAVDNESWPEDLALRMRAGVHLGEVDPDGGRYYGSSVNQAAQLRALAHGGQALASRAVAEISNDNSHRFMAKTWTSHRWPPLFASILSALQLSPGKSTMNNWCRIIDMYRASSVPSSNP